MCGPLAVCFLGARGGATAYRVGRIAAYALAGAAAGGLGAALGATALPQAGVWVAAVLAAGLLLFALGGTGKLARVPGLAGTVSRAASWSNRLPPVRRAAALGLLTPLLPCGLLYAVYAAALVAGGAWNGAVVTLGFALGSLPVLALAQLNLGWLRRRLSPSARELLQRGVLLGAAAVLIWRAWASHAGGSCCGS
jgi:hypothetical protein